MLNRETSGYCGQNMNLNDLLLKQGFEPREVLVFRHRPWEEGVRKVLGWLAAEKPHVFKAYQQEQKPRVEKAMERIKGNGYVVSCIGQEPGKALFVGLYRIIASRPLTIEKYWSIPENIELKKLGMEGWTGKDGREVALWFDLELRDFYKDWKGKLVLEWPGGERSWWRWAHSNVMPILALHEESVLDAAMPDWKSISLSWKELSVLPKRWEVVLRQWRGIYYIFDKAEEKGYVGSAYGEDNLLGRWQKYAASGHGGNALLRKCNPHNFRFTILQRVSPDMESDDVIRLENSWKERLHTRKPYGLNDN